MKVVIFSVADKEYGAEISQVREVTRMRKVTIVPDVAKFIEGVISLRGKVIPLINLRKKFGLAAEAAPSSRILVTKVQADWMGILVDRVRDVVALKDEEINAPDEILKSARYLRGVTKYQGSLVLIVDLAELLMGDEAVSFRAVHDRVEVKKKEVQ